MNNEVIKALISKIEKEYQEYMNSIEDGSKQEQMENERMKDRHAGRKEVATHLGVLLEILG